MTVFIIQKQMKYDHHTENFIPKFDLTSAEEYGDFEYLLSPTAQPFNPAPILEELHDKLENFSDSDHLLLIGNPCLIGFATAIAAHYNDGRVSLLQWSGKDKKYIAITACVIENPIVTSRNY